MANAGLNFIIGSPRSGTSLLRLMLNAHPHITAPPECGFAMWLRDWYSNLDLGDPSVVARFARDVSASRKFETWGLPPGYLSCELARRRYDSYPQMAAAVHTAYATLRGKIPKVLMDKNNFYISEAHRVAIAFPEAKFVHLLRDGRDVACSYIDLAKRKIESEYRPNLPAEISAIAEEWRRNCMAADELPLARTITVRFEDLVAQPKSELTRVCSFLAIDFHPDMLEFFRWNDEPKAFLQWKEKTLEPLDSGNIGRYLQYLRPHEIATFEHVAGDVLRRFGYRLETNVRL